MEPSTQLEGYRPLSPRICRAWTADELSESEIIPGVFVPKHSRKTLQQIDEEFLKTKKYKDLGVWFTNGLTEGFDVCFPWNKGPWPEHKYLLMRMYKSGCQCPHWDFNTGKSFKSWGTTARDRTEAYYKYLQWVSNDFTKERIDDNYKYEYESQYCNIIGKEYEMEDFVSEEKGLDFLEKYAKRECYALVVNTLETPTAPELYKKEQWSPIEIFSEAADTISDQYSIDLVDLDDFKWY